MSSNNLDEKLLLQYITACFHNWGLIYISPEVLKRAKKNQDQAIQPLTRLLFDLSILHIFHYRHFPHDLAIDFHQEEQMLEVILAHLFEVQCPFVIVKESKENTTVSFDFTSSKYLLITCGWLMAVSNFFSQTTEKLFRRKFQEIYKPKPLNFTKLRQKYSNVLKQVNLHHSSDKLSRISYLAKILKARKYSIECLVDKKSKILKRLKQEIKKVDANLAIEDVLSSGNPQQTESLEAELRECLQFENEYMGFRKYWWIWLDQKIIASQYSELPTHFENFQRKQIAPESIKYNISIDLDFVSKYVNLLHSAQAKMQTIHAKIEELQIRSDKVFKQIQRDIIQELKDTVQQSQGREDDIPSFIGQQLQQYMNLQPKNTQNSKQTKKQIDKVAEKSNKELQKAIKSFVSSIDAIVLI